MYKVICCSIDLANSERLEPSQLALHKDLIKLWSKQWNSMQSEEGALYVLK